MININIFNLFGRLTLDDSEYKKKIEDVKKKNNEVADGTKKMSLSAIASWSAIGVGVLAVANAMKDLIYNTTEYAGSIKDLAQVYETTYQNVQELNYIAQESGKNAEWVLRKAQGSGESYAQILGLTNEEYKEMIANAHEMGLVMENEVIDSADMLGDRLSAIKYQWQAVLVGLLAGEEDAEVRLQMFFDRVMEVVEDFTPRILQFAVKLLSQIAIVLVRYLPQIVNDLTVELLSALVTSLPELIWNLVKGLAETIINNIIYSSFGWLLDLLGVKVPRVDVFSDSTSSGLSTPSMQGYEITEKIEQDLTITITSDGVTANDKDVSRSIEHLIDVKLGRMLGGV